MPAIPVAEAQALVLTDLSPLPLESVALADALDRVLAAALVSEHDVPGWDNSAMDGFAVLAGPPRTLTVVDEARAGRPATAAVTPGTAIAISTGAPVPAGAESVVPVERTDRDGDRLVLLDAVVPGAHIRCAGEDVARGATVLAAGTRLGPAELALAAAAGHGALPCARRPRVAVVVTGDELRPPGSPLGPGEIHETNGLALTTSAARDGARATAVHVTDDPAILRAALTDALATADLVLTAGGVSVGVHDHVKPVLAGLGVEQRFWRVDLRPGGPTWCGAVPGGPLVLGLPGNPVSALVTYALFARPALRALQGLEPVPSGRSVPLAVAVPRGARAHYVRVVESTDGVRPTGHQGSHRLSSIALADGMIRIEPGVGDVPPGTVVDLLGA